MCLSFLSDFLLHGYSSVLNYRGRGDGGWRMGEGGGSLIRSGVSSQQKFVKVEGVPIKRPLGQAIILLVKIGGSSNYEYRTGHSLI